MTVTAQLASKLVGARPQDIPPEVWHEARRALLNFLGCAIGGSDEPATSVALRAVLPYSGGRTVPLLGRSEQLDALNASLINGIASHVHDYDDTTPSNFSHTTAPLASALLAHAGEAQVSGADLLHAFILGFEAATKIGNAVSPDHYAKGWHITSTIGVIGAAIAMGRLMRLDERRMAWAIGLAATQSCGLRDVFGSMAKSFNPGRAAQSGFLSAVLARQGFTSGAEPLEGARGFAAVLSTPVELSDVVDSLGVVFELPTNTYKPFPCGLVIHPTIDACIALRQEGHVDPATVNQVRLRVAPIVFDLCNKKDISTGLEGKFSVYHAAAVGLVRGKAGLAEFSDAAVNDSDIRSIRERVTAEVDPDLSAEAVVVEISSRDRPVIAKRLEQAIGGPGRPLSDSALEVKFRDQAGLALPLRKVDRLVDLCWNVEGLENAGDLVEASCPK